MSINELFDDISQKIAEPFVKEKLIRPDYTCYQTIKKVLEQIDKQYYGANSKDVLTGERLERTQTTDT